MVRWVVLHPKKYRAHSAGNEKDAWTGAALQFRLYQRGYMLPDEAIEKLRAAGWRAVRVEVEE